MDPYLVQMLRLAKIQHAKGNMNLASLGKAVMWRSEEESIQQKNKRAHFGYCRQLLDWVPVLLDDKASFHLQSDNSDVSNFSATGSIYYDRDISK